MKIAIVVPGFSSEEGDWCIPVVVDVVRALSQRAEVHVFALRYPFRSDRYHAYGAQVHALGGHDARRFSRVWLGLRTLFAIAIEHGRSPFDVVHGVWADEPGFFATITGWVLRRPSVVSVMGGELAALPDIEYGGELHRWNRLLTRFALRYARDITAASGIDAERADRIRGQRKAHRRVQHVVWGVNRSLFATDAGTPGWPDHEFHILHVASLVPVKDQQTLLAAFREVRMVEPLARLDIAGDGPGRAVLEQLVTRLGLDEAVHFHGHVHREALAGLYRRCHVFVLSSLHEQQPAVVLEAALCGRLVVGTQVGILPDLTAAGALVVPTGNPEALAQAVLKGLDSADRQRRGDALKAMVEDRYLAQHTADQLVQLYARAAAPRVCIEDRVSGKRR